MPKKKTAKKTSPKLSSRAKQEITSSKRFFISMQKDMKKISAQTKLLLGIGLLFILVPLFFYVNEGIQLAYITPHVVPVQNTYAVPTRISIPSVRMDLPIQETVIRHGFWQIADSAISHLTISARPGENGAIILYGHNTNDRFGPIRWLSKGATITLAASGNKQFVYKVVETLDVAPDKVSILLSQKGETLILYTCDGFADLQRFIVIAKPVR